jgi:LysM repeat protein
MAAFAGPEDVPVGTTGEWESGPAGGPRRHDSSGRRRGGAGRWVVRIAVPLVFVGGVVALLLLVTQSGILNPSNEPSPTPSASKSATVVKVYTVKKGDTLSGIALRYGVTVQAILEVNPKLDANNLTVRTKVKIPSASQ